MIELHLGDSLELMPVLAEEGLRADLLCTDPPYNIAKHASVITRRGRFKGKEISPVFDFDHDTIQPEDWIPLAKGCLKEDAVLVTFAAAQQLGRVMDVLEATGFFVRHVAAWVKTNPVPQLMKKKWSSGLEYFVVATRGEDYHYNWREGAHPNYIVSPICMGKERTAHPAQKPLKVMEDIIRWWSFEGDLVLDPFMGVGTTGVEAMRQERGFVGIEIEEEWYRLAEMRVKDMYQSHDTIGKKAKKISPVKGGSHRPRPRKGKQKTHAPRCCPS